MDKWADESLTQPKETSMLWTIIVILVVLWLLGFIGHFWRRSDPSSARDCRHRARYSAHSGQTALSDSGFATVVSAGFASSPSRYLRLSGSACVSFAALGQPLRRSNAPDFLFRTVKCHDARLWHQAVRRVNSFCERRLSGVHSE